MPAVATCSVQDLTPVIHSHHNPVKVPNFFPKSLFTEKHSVTCVTVTASADSMTTATKFCECKSGITVCMDAEERSNQASKEGCNQ